MSFAAGIIPYKIVNNEFIFLLGLERSNNKWSGFVGGSEPGESPVNTAIREFNEETSMIFYEYPINIINIPPIIEKTSTGKNVYLWFVNYPFNLNLNKFHYNQHIYQNNIYKEKSDLRWFNLNEIKNGNILYRLKQTILFHFK